MKEIFIHIGMHKTGSSSIQKSLQEGLNDEGYHYFQLGELNHSGPLVNMFSKKPEKYHGNVKRGIKIEQIQQKRTELLESFKKQMENNADKIGILSAEDLCNFDREELENLRRFIKPNIKINIIGYVRNPKDYIASAFQQLIKGGLSTFDLRRAYPNYTKLENHRVVFGRENCSYVHFSKEDLLDPDVVIDFAKRVGIDIEKLSSIKINESISPLALKILFIYRQNSDYGTDSDSIRRNNNLVQQLNEIDDQRKLTISESAYAQWEESNTEDKAWFHRNIKSTIKIASNHKNQVSIDNENNFLSLDELELNVISKKYRQFKCEGTESFEEITKLLVYLCNQLINKAKPTNNSKRSFDLVYQGTDGYLFLSGGAHTPFEFSFSNKKLDKKILSTFINNIKWREQFCKKRTIPYCHIITPDKQSVLTSYTGFDLSDHLGSRVIESIPPSLSSVVSYPRAELASIDELYYKVDSHCTPIGYIKLTELALKKLQCSVDFDSIIKKLAQLRENIVKGEEFDGDLGSKLPSKPKETKLIQKPNPMIKFFTNDDSTGNTGICDLYFNFSEVKQNKRLLIFGDSFGRGMSKVLSHLFSEVIFCRTEHFHPEMVNMFKPDLIISQNAERYIASISNDRSRIPFLLLKGIGTSPSSLPFLNALRAALSFGLDEYNKFIFELTEN